MTHTFSEIEITMDEIHDAGFGVKLHMLRETSWEKTIKFMDNKSNTYIGRLRWDENWGYEIFWDTNISDELHELSTRPEFEYVIDAYTNDELENRK